jgi:asparagine synthase (glutamine-hydrolysing)
MVAAVRHRGPDAAGLYLSDDVALGHARLSIIDLAGGLQPLTNEDESLWLVCNGEIFNYVELRAELEARGHRFRTGSDCETIVHLYEEEGPGCLSRLNGQFALALWDRRQRQLLLARDRLGIRPLYYAEAGGYLAFGSEIKALLALPFIPREVDPVALGQVFTTWAPVPPRTMFQGIASLRPGHLLLVTADHTVQEQYWRLEYPEWEADRPMTEPEAAERLRDLLDDATRLQLRADVPVAAYVSGGLDSSTTTALAQRRTTGRLETFGISFTDDEFDERPHQERVARMLGTEHHTLLCRSEDIARALPEVIWHAETPLVRTAPAPLYLLAKLVRQHGFKVVLTGEGADEILLGYDIFKETAARLFWSRQRDSKMRPALLRRLYAHIPDMAKTAQPYLEAFFGAGLDRPDAPGFSHRLRWNNTARLHRYFTDEVRSVIASQEAEDLDALLAEQEANWHPVSCAQHTEITTFLDPYLLSSQGDRVAMAHAVEGRVPFLDHRVVEFCNGLPPRMKLHGLREKVLLKRAVADLLPTDILERPKQPFRAPIREAFVGAGAPEYVQEVLDPARVAADGMFKPQAVTWLLNRASGEGRLGELDNMALVGLISAGLFRSAFLDGSHSRWPRYQTDSVVVADHRIVSIEAQTMARV